MRKRVYRLLNLVQKKTSNIAIRIYNVQGINKSTPKTYLMFLMYKVKTPLDNNTIQIYQGLILNVTEINICKQENYKW